MAHAELMGWKHRFQGKEMPSKSDDFPLNFTPIETKDLWISSYQPSLIRITFSTFTKICAQNCLAWLIFAHTQSLIAPMHRNTTSNVGSSRVALGATWHPLGHSAIQVLHLSTRHHHCIQSVPGYIHCTSWVRGRRCIHKLLYIWCVLVNVPTMVPVLFDFGTCMEDVQAFDPQFVILTITKASNSYAHHMLIGW